MKDYIFCIKDRQLTEDYFFSKIEQNPSETFKWFRENKLIFHKIINNCKITINLFETCFITAIELNNYTDVFVKKEWVQELIDDNIVDYILYEHSEPNKIEFSAIRSDHIREYLNILSNCCYSERAVLMSNIFKHYFLSNSKSRLQNISLPKNKILSFLVYESDTIFKELSFNEDGTLIVSTPTQLNLLEYPFFEYSWTKEHQWLRLPSNISMYYPILWVSTTEFTKEVYNKCLVK